MTRKEYNNRDTQTEARLTALETKLDEVINNHLAHMDAKIDKILWFLITSAFTFATGLIYIILKLQ